MRYPARGPADGEQHGEHVEGNPDRPQDDARVEVDVRIEAPLREIVICQSRLLHFPGNVEQRVVDAHGLQKVVSGLLEDPCARIEITVNAMPETHQPDPRLTVLGLCEVRADRHAIVPDPLQHLDHRHVRPTM